MASSIEREDFFPTFVLLPLHIVAMFTDVPFQTSKPLFIGISAKSQKCKLHNIAKPWGESKELPLDCLSFKCMEASCQNNIHFCVLLKTKHCKHSEAKEELKRPNQAQHRSGDAAKCKTSIMWFEIRWFRVDLIAVKRGPWKALAHVVKDHVVEQQQSERNCAVQWHKSAIYKVCKIMQNNVWRAIQCWVALHFSTQAKSSFKTSSFVSLCGVRHNNRCLVLINSCLSWLSLQCKFNSLFSTPPSLQLCPASNSITCARKEPRNSHI